MTSTTEGSGIDLGFITGPSKVYIVEHFTVLIMLILTIISGIGLFNSLINHFLDDSTGKDAIYSVISFEELALYIAMAIVAVPLFVLFYTRTRKAERAHPALLQSRANRRLGYLFLMIAALFMIGYLVSFVYSSSIALINAEAVSDGEGWLQTSLKQIFAILFIGLVSVFVSKMLPSLDGGKDA